VDIERADPIFILGIMPRSGTNFLWDLLCLHPDCAAGRSPVREDFFLEASDHLLAYTNAVRAWWDPSWGVIDDDLMNVFHQSLGDGLISFLWVDRRRRLLTKTPSVTHLARFFRFFPRARLIILVRDGRSVAQSAMATFGWDLDRAARHWAKAADQIRSFDSQRRGGGERYLIVRYEDLLSDLKGAMLPILRFLELEEDAFDFEAAGVLPVRGSSFYFGAERHSIHWDPVVKGPDFDPRERWRRWTPKMHARFEWLAGEQLRYFEYGSIVPPVERWSEAMHHRMMDWGWRSRWALRATLHAARARLGSASRPLRQRLGLIRPSQADRRGKGEEVPK